MTKKVICRVIWNKKTSLDISLEDSSCVIPSYIMKSGEVSVGVYADDDEQLTTEPWVLGVKKSIREKEFETAVPHKAVWKEINEKVSNTVTQTEMTTAISKAIEESGHVKADEFDSKINDYLAEQGLSDASGRIEQLEENISSTQWVNMLASSNISQYRGIGATITDLENGDIEVVSTTHYGRCDFVLEDIKTGAEKYYLCVLKANCTVADGTFSTVFYCYENNTNMGLATNVNNSGVTAIVGDITYVSLHKLSGEQINCDRFDIGLMNKGASTYTVDTTSNVLVDVTDLYHAGLTDINDLLDVIGVEYFEQKKAKITDAIHAYKADETTLSKYGSQWYEKTALVIGDSLTAAKKWQTQLVDMLGMNVITHAKGGISIVNCVDGENGAGEFDNETATEGTLYALNVDDVKDVDLIVLFAGYNNRGTADGKVGDCYATDGTGQVSIAGYMQYAINRIYEELTEAGNITCKILIVTVDCSGKYSYIDADGYDEYPLGSGQSMETLANIQKAVAEYNSLPCLDLWHNSGINRNTWNVFGASAVADNTKYSPYELDSDGNAVSEDRIKYVTGNSYYQWRDGEVVLEEYTERPPYPYNADQLHKSTEGYKRIGECIVGAIIDHYGY